MLRVMEEVIGVKIEKKLDAYIRDKGIQISTISERTGISRTSLYESFRRNRELRIEEYFTICTFLGADPMEFVERPSA